MSESKDAAEVAVTDNREAHRFESEFEGQLSVAYYRRRGDTIEFTHTEVPPAQEGRGIAAALARAALDQARAEGLEVIPSCPYFASYIKRHPEYRDLLGADA